MTRRCCHLLTILALTGALLLTVALTGRPVSALEGGVEIGPEYDGVVQAGSDVYYRHTLTNTGATTETFYVSAEASAAWPVEVLGDAYPDGTIILPIYHLGPGMTATLQVRLSVPSNASSGVVNTTTVSATGAMMTALAENIAVVDARRVYLPLVLADYPPRWQRLSGTAGVSFYDVVACPENADLLYAGTGERGLYRSLDGGESWQPWLFAGLRSAPVLFTSACDAYVAVWGQGIYRVTPEGQTTSLRDGYEELRHVYGVALSPDGETLYAGTASDGVYKTPVAAIAWTHISGGVADQRIRSLYFVEGTLYAGGRGCRLYRFDAQDNVTLETIESTACNDEQVWAVARSGEYLYAGLGGLGLYRRPFVGGTWLPVAGWGAGQTVFRHGLATHDGQLYAAIYGQGVIACDAAGTCAPFRNAGLGEATIRGLRVMPSETGAFLFAAGDDGLWRVALVP